VRTKDSCWSVGTIYDPRELPGVSTAGPGIGRGVTEAEYIAAGHCCAQLLWMRQTLRDYGYKLSKVPLLCDNESAIRMADNPVEHSRTKHINIQ
jgi:hypothetical protein